VSVVLVYFKNNETPSCVCLFLYIVLIFSMRELYIYSKNNGTLNCFY